MFRLQDLKISNKILISPFIIMAFLVGLSLFSIDTLKKDQKAFEHMVEIKFEVLNSGNKLLIEMGSYNTFVYKVFNYVTNAYEDNEINEQLQQVVKVRKVVLQQLKNLKELTKENKKIQKIMVSIEKNINNYNESVQNAMNDVMNITLDKLLDADIYFSKIEKELKQIIMETKKSNRVSYENELEHISSTINTLYISLIVVLVISFFISLLVSKSIKIPLTVFQNGLLEFFRYLNQETKEAKTINIVSKDELGSMAEIINNNIEKTKIEIEKDRSLVENAITCANKAKQGFLDVKIEGNTTNSMLNELKDVINEMLKEIELNIKKSMDVLASFTAYNYKSRVENFDINGELKALSDDINSLGDAICLMLVENKKVGLELSNNADYLSNSVKELTTAANNQAASLEETAAAVEQITSNMKNSSKNIGQMTTYAKEVSSSVNEGETLASKTALSMDEINEQTNAIAEAITVIDQIAFQTNILSLNAAVEAATAGESGKGFAVVAQEVRNLASRSAEAAKEIKELVETATSKANEGKKISTNMINGYERLNTNIHNTLTLIEEVSNSSKEQFSAMEQINNTVNQLDQMTQQNAVATSQANNVANQVNEIAEKVVSNTENKEFSEEIKQVENNQEDIGKIEE